VFRTLVYCVVLIAAAVCCSRLIAGERYALLVGVRSYSKTELTSLRFTEQDITELQKVLLAGGYQKDNVVLMTQTLGAEDTRFLPIAANIRDELDLLMKEVGQDDHLLIAFAGHGVQFSGDKDIFFCPADAKLADKTRLVSLGEIYAKLKDSPAATKVLLVDACRNDPQAGVKRGEVNLEPVGSRKFVAPPQGVAALFSCRATESAFEDPDLKHGIFFYHVIKAMKADGDLNKDGNVSLTELELATFGEVQKHARVKYGTPQTPERRGDTSGEITLVSLPRKLAPPIPMFPIPAVPSFPRPIVKRKPTPLQAPFDTAAIEEKRADWVKYLGLGSTTETNSAKMVLALIPPGRFIMGAPISERGREEDETQHGVTLSDPFFMGVTEVTLGQFRQFVKEKPYVPDSVRSGGQGWSLSDKKFLDRNTAYSWEKTGFAQTDAHPVVNVTHKDATEFCDWLTRKEGKKYRLPTEAEWEYACRAGTKTAFSSGDSPEGLVAVGNVVDASAKEQFPNWTALAGRDGFVFTAPVGRFRPNNFGLYDMHGNVWEWCQDWYHDKYYLQFRTIDAVNPQGDSSERTRRVLRGGSWQFLVKGRSADRYFGHPGDIYLNNGFRVVCEIDVKPAP
jgi:sulfatase modifying factor 1